jgi:thioredoxin reductase (NADPH)
LRYAPFFLVEGAAEPDGRFRMEVTRAHDRKSYLSEAVVFATGYYDNPNYLGIPGEDLPHVTHYFVEGHPYWHQRVIVIGAGNIGGQNCSEAAVCRHVRTNRCKREVRL